MPAIFIGVIGGVGGSIVRDVMLNMPIAVMHVGSLYAVAAVGGCSLLVALVALGAPITIAAIVCVVVTTLVRILAVRFGWSLPEQRSLGHLPRIPRWTRNSRPRRR